MPKNKKPKASTSPKELIEPTKIYYDAKQLKFSFVNLNLNSKKYNMDLIGDNKQKAKFYNDFIKKIQEYSTHKNFKKHISDNGTYRDTNHIHQIDWGDSRIRESCFTNLNPNEMEQIKDDCWQLGINSTTFRIHGYFVDDVFYVVWLDPMHELYHKK